MCLAVKNHVTKCVYHQTTQLNLFPHISICLVHMFEAFKIHVRPWDRIQHGKTKGGIAWLKYLLIDVSGSKNHVAKCVYHQTTQLNLFPHKYICLVPMFEAFQIHVRPWDRIEHGKSQG